MTYFNQWLCLITCLLLLTSCLQETPPSPHFSILTWNVHNLFDDQNNGTEYPEFIPGTTWNTTQMLVRMERVSQVLLESCEGGPDVVALQEIENLNTLDTLRERFLPGKYPYRAFGAQSGSAVGPAILSKFPILRVGTLNVPPVPGEVLRPLLEVELNVSSHRVIIINNHWKSRQPTPEATEPHRLAAAKVLRTRIKVLTGKYPGELVLAAGDFNFSSENQALPKNEVSDLWDNSNDPGSYFYKGKWERLDHIFLPIGWELNSGWRLKDFETVQLLWTLTPEGTPRGWSSRDRGGVSDHLPLLGRFFHQGTRQSGEFPLK